MKKEGNNKKILILGLLGLFAIMFIGGVLVSAAFDPNSWYGGVTDFLGLGDTWQQIVLGIVVLAIIYAGMYDILELVSIFENKWVKVIISLGIAIIASMVGFVRTILVGAVTFGATLGAIGIFIEIIVAIVIFTGLTWGSSKIALWSAERKGLKSIAQGRKFAGNLEALKNVASVAGTKRQKRFFGKLGGDD